MRTLLMSIGAAPRPAPTPPDDDDDRLLLAIGREQNQAAFSTLYARYQRDAFNLALHLTGRSDLAEDAVQEGMLNLWRSASTYRPGAARSWLLRVVANASLKVMRHQRRQEKKMTAHSAQSAEPAPLSEPDRSRDPERSEMLVALGQSLHELPSLNRRLVALYFGAGFTHQEIGKELALPTRTVSFKIEETLQKLRLRLSQSGFAAAAPLVCAEGLREAIFQGPEAPAGLAERVLESLSLAAKNSIRAAGAPSAAVGISWVAATALILSAGVLGWWWSTQSPSNLKISDPPGATPASSSRVDAPSASPAPVKPLHLVWNFERGPADDLHLFQGAWSWKELPTGGAMTNLNAPNSQWIAMLLPPRLAPKPHLITFQLDAVSGDADFGLEATWINEQGVLPYQALISRYNLSGKRTHSMHWYILGEYSIQKINGTTAMAYQYERPFPGNRVCVNFLNYGIQKLEIRELSDLDLAGLQLDPFAEINQLRKQNCEVVRHPGIQPLNWNAIPEKYR